VNFTPDEKSTIDYAQMHYNIRGEYPNYLNKQEVCLVMSKTARLLIIIIGILTITSLCLVIAIQKPGTDQTGDIIEIVEISQEIKYTDDDFSEIDKILGLDLKNAIIDFYYKEMQNSADDFGDIVFQSKKDIDDAGMTPISIGVSDPIKTSFTEEKTSSGYVITGEIMLSQAKWSKRFVMTFISDKGAFTPKFMKVSDYTINVNLIDIDSDGKYEIAAERYIGDGLNSGHSIISVWAYGNNNFNTVFESDLSEFIVDFPYSYGNKYEFRRNVNDPKLVDLIFTISTSFDSETFSDTGNPFYELNHKIFVSGKPGTFTDNITYVFDGERYVPNKEVYEYRSFFIEWAEQNIEETQEQGTQEADSFRYPVKVDENWGFIDENGKVIIKPQYWRVSFFSEGLALVEQENEKRDESKYIDVNGNVAIEPMKSIEYETVFSEGLAVFHSLENGKYGYINKKGEVVIEPKFDEADLFTEGAAIVRINYKYGFIDTKGNYLIEPIFDQAEAFSEGLANVAFGGKSGYVDKNGNYVIGLVFEEFDRGRFSDGLVPARVGEKWGYINKKGEFVIPPEYEWTINFYEGLGMVKKDGKWGFMDTTGKFVIEPIYEDAYPFQEGLAPVATNFISDFEDATWYQYIDRNGNVAIDASFRHEYRAGYGTHDFINGIAKAWTEDDKLVYFDKSGNIIWVWD
jgi:hypothetical protein